MATSQAKHCKHNNITCFLPSKLVFVISQIILAPDPYHSSFMDRQQSYEPTATIMHSSSIALLQERFRQLERAREMRQQREFFQFFTEAEQVKPAATITTTTVVYEPPNKFSHHELLFPSKQQPLISSQKSMKGQCHFELQVREIPDLANLCSANLLMMQTQYNYFDESDVDTSLHL